MKTNKIIIALSLLACAFKGTAQQDPMISQYMSNQLFINSAYAGSHDYGTLSGLYRKQWVNFPGAPRTSFISYDSRVNCSNVGLGFTFINDKLGVTEESQIAGNFAYHIPLAKGHLSLGIKASLSYYTADLTELTIWDANDRTFAQNINGSWIPNFGTGAYYYTDKFYAGLSVPHLLNHGKPSAGLMTDIKKVPNYERHYFFSMGYVMTLASDVYIKPSTLVKYVEDAPIEADFNVNVFFMNRFMVGGAYRTKDGFVAMTELRITNKLRLGYAYDIPTTKINNYSNGTHEVMLSYDFLKDLIKIQTPRFF
jgi:type IX secretion system PorP/SprF family membrane protein